MAYVEHDSGQREAIATGCSMGAFHALLLGLTRADLFPVAICQSGSYDPSRWNAWGERGDASYFANPTDFVPHLHGDHLDWLRSRASILLVVGEGPWEVHPTESLPQAGRWPACSPSAASRTSSTSGATTPPTTGPGGRSRSRIICRGSAEASWLVGQGWSDGAVAGGDPDRLAEASSRLVVTNRKLGPD